MAVGLFQNRLIVTCINHFFPRLDIYHLVTFSNDRHVFLIDNINVLLMDEGYMFLMHNFFHSNRLNHIMIYILVMLMNHIDVVLNNYIFMMLVDNLFVYLYDSLLGCQFRGC